MNANIHGDEWAGTDAARHVGAVAREFQADGLITAREAAAITRAAAAS